MRIRAQKWGNSLAARIPKSFARDTALTEETEVELELENGRLVIAPVREEEYDLTALLERVTPETIHAEIDVGSRAGKELW